jgi:hypothetical protein
MAELFSDPRQVKQSLSDAGLVYLYHISLPSFALPEADLRRLKNILNRLIASISRTYKVQPEFFVQTDSLTGTWTELLSENGSYWNVQTGLGVRPGWPLPNPSKAHEIKIESLAALAALPTASTSELELIYRITKDEHFELLYPDMQCPSGADVYLGCGGLLVFMVSDGEGFLQHVRQVFAADVDPAFQNLDFFVPIFDLKDFEQASAELMRLWFSLFDVYIAEVRSDPGLLIASRHDLDT